MIYKALGTSNQTNQTLKSDVNGKAYFEIDADESFISEDFDIIGFADIVIEVSGLTGSGALTYQKSIDRINWINEKNESGTADFSQVVSTDGTINLNDKRGGRGWRRLVWTKDNASAGIIVIKVMCYE